MDFGYLDVKDADVFEAVDLYTKEYNSLSHAVSVTLIKVRIIRDLRILQSSSEWAERPMLVSMIVAVNKGIMDSNDQGPAIKRVGSLVAQLYEAVKKFNSYFWPALVYLVKSKGPPTTL